MNAGFVGWLKLIICEVIRVFVIAILYVMCHGSFPWCYYDRGREGGDGRSWRNRPFLIAASTLESFVSYKNGLVYRKQKFMTM